MGAETLGLTRRQPELSVLMAVRDGEKHLEAALDTLAEQTFWDYELVIIDDGSQDQTPGILAARAAMDSRLRVIRNDNRIGIPKALNLGLAHCRGTFVARADADDVYAPQRFSLQMDFMRRDPDIGVLGSGYRRIHANGRVHSIEHPPLDDATIRARQFFINSLLHPAVLFRAEVVRSVGGYDERYWTAQDTDLWARLRKRTRFANLPELLVDYRLHDRSMMRTRGAEGRSLSLTVPERLLTELLGRKLERRDVAAAIGLFQTYEPVPTADLPRGIALLREALDQVAHFAPPVAARRVRREAAQACLKQVSRHHWPNRTTSTELVKAAFALDPAIAFRSRTHGALLRRLTG